MDFANASSAIACSWNDLSSISRATFRWVQYNRHVALSETARCDALSETARCDRSTAPLPGEFPHSEFRIPPPSARVAPPFDR
jgi:hypothetical protein